MHFIPPRFILYYHAAELMSNPVICVMSKEFELIRQKTLPPTCIQAEGKILGTAGKMFTIAGPVIVYGVSASVIYGLIYWIIKMIRGG